jgi:sulfur carrier protein ThiS adenylyltransferase
VKKQYFFIVGVWMMDEDKVEFNSRNNSEFLKRKSKFKIAIAGCGGLGSNIAQMLVRSGIDKLKIIDFDTVCISNLNRQFYFVDDLGKLKTDALECNLKRIGLTLDVEKRALKVTRNNFKELFIDVDILIEAFDNVESKKMMLDGFLNLNEVDKYLICASGMAGIGSSNNIVSKQMGNNVYICGDFKTVPTEKNGIMAPRVMLTAAHQANIVLRIIARAEFVKNEE